LFETAEKRERAVNDVITEAVCRYLEAIDAVASSPAQIQQIERKRVLRELQEVNDKLVALHGKINKEGTRESRLGEIGFLLGNLDEKKGPLGVYAALKGNWDLIRFRAAEDLKDEPEWATALKVTELEVDEACDQAQEIDRLVQSRQEFRSENRVLRGKVANPEQDEPEGKAAEGISETRKAPDKDKDGD
jgi:hypothetical protein